MSRLRWSVMVFGILCVGFLMIRLPALAEKAKADRVKVDKVEADKGEWLTFRGDAAQTGVVPGKLPAKLEVLWQYSTGDSIESPPAVQGGKVFFGSMDEHFYCVALEDGKEKWKKKYGSFKAAPGLHDGRIYIGDSDGVFYALNATDGSKIWSLDTRAEIVSGANFAGDKILFGSYNETLYCLDRDGKEVWTFKASGPINSSPSVANGFTFVAGCDSNLHVVDLKDGKEVRAVDLEGQAAATAAVVGEQLYVGTMTNQVKGLDWKKGTVLWTFEAESRSQPFYASAAVTEELVIVGGRDKRIWALYRKTGKPAWSVPTDGKIDSSPVVVGGRVYVGSLDGSLYVLDASNGRTLQTIGLDGPISASPAVVGGRLLIGTQKGTLYCLGAKK